MQNKAPSRPAILMFVDDNEADIALVKDAYAVEKIKFDDEVYQDGDSALARLEDNSKPLPDIIFIDRHLDGSGISGDELIEKICLNRDRYSSCHVVCVSSGDIETVRKDKFTKMGMETFLPKPLQMVHIKTLISMMGDYYYQIMRQLHQAVA